MSCSACYRDVPAQTEIIVRRMSGEELITYFCQEGEEVVTLSLAFVQCIGAAENIPRLCLDLVWGEIEARTPVGFMGDSSLVSFSLIVTCATRKLPTDWEELFLPKDTFILPPGIEPYCLSCGDPCDDNDDERRKANSAKCEPCWVCSRCRVSLRGKMDGFPCCFLCVREEGLELGVDFQASESTMRRLLVWTSRLALIE